MAEQQVEAIAVGPSEGFYAWGTREGAGPGQSDEVSLSFGDSLNAIPATAQIQSIRIAVTAWQDDLSGAVFPKSVQLTVNGILVGEPATGDLATRQLTQEPQAFEFDGGLWGRAWTASEVRSQLGVVVVIGNEEISDLVCHVDSATAVVTFE